MKFDVDARLKKYEFDADILRQIKDLYELDDRHSILALLADYFFLVASIFLAELWLGFLPISIIIIGSRQRALATLLHEASHLVLSKNRRLNKILGTFFSGYLIFQTWDSYKKSHVLNHHIFLGNKIRDPDYNYYLSSGVYDALSKRDFYVRYFFRPILQIDFFRNVKYLLVNRFTANLTKQELLRMLFALLVFTSIGTYFVGWYFIFLYWLLPYLTVFQVISWFIEISEHYPLVGKASVDLYASRNRFGNFIENFLTGIHGERFHLIHHLFPAIPFWNMSKAHRILLRDKNYRSVNSGHGGMFTSSNGAPALWFSEGFQAQRVS